jgi:hypothetical protein
MIGKYTYSFNGEHYRGAFATREEALAEAIEAARRSSSSPQTVYVGRMVPADPKASGHARAVLTHMAARAREEFGDNASSYLAKLPKPQIEQLDEALELVILGWLERTELMPTFFKVDAIGEYVVPTASPEKSSLADLREVQEIGSGGCEM